MWDYIANETIDNNYKIPGNRHLTFQEKKTDLLVIPNAENVTLMSYIIISLTECNSGTIQKLSICS